MIDDATLRRMEAENIACGDTENEWIIRTARRYLALRKQFAPFSMDIDGNHSWCWRGNPSRMKGNTFDAVADRLLEGGE